MPGIRRMNNMAELKPCPFGCKAKPRIGFDYIRTSYTPFFYEECPLCGCKGPVASNEYLAIDAWNRRVK